MNIVEIEQEIDKSKSRAEHVLSNFQKDNQKKYEKYLDGLKNFYFITNFISSTGFKAEGEKVVLQNLFTKACLDLFGINYCLQHGLEVQAQVIGRALYETKVTLELLLREDTKERLKLFHDFQYIQRWKQIEFHKEFISEKDFNSLGLEKEYIELINNKYDEVKDNYHPKNPINWAWKIFKDELNNRNPSMLEICKYLGRKYLKEYVMTYPTASITSHPNQILVDYFAKVVDEKNVIFNSPKYTNLTKTIACISLSDCAVITISILNYFKIPDYEIIIEYIKSFVADILEFDYNKPF